MKRLIGIKIDPNWTAIRAVINRDRQVLDRAKRKIVSRGAMAGKAKIVIERHNIDAESE